MFLATPSLVQLFSFSSLEWSKRQFIDFNNIDKWNVFAVSQTHSLSSAIFIDFTALLQIDLTEWENETIFTTIPAY